MAALGACLRHRPSRRVGLVAVLPIFELTLADDVVDDITFSSEPVPSADTDFRVAVDHSSRAARLVGDHVEIASIVVVSDPLEARAAELGFLPRGASGDDDDPGYHSAVLDATYEAHEVIEMLAVLDEERADGAVEWIDDEPRDIDQAEATLRWQTRLLELVAPQPLIERRRRYDLVGNYRVDHDESQTLMATFTINAHGLRRSH